MKTKIFWLARDGDEIKNGLIRLYLKEPKAKDEWCAEPYMETNDTELTEQNFIKVIKELKWEEKYKWFEGNAIFAFCSGIFKKTTNITIKPGECKKFKLVEEK